MLVILYVVLYSIVNSTRAGADRGRTVATLQNARRFPTDVVMNVVTVDTFKLKVIPLRAMLISRTLMVKNTLVRGVPQMLFKLVFVVIVIITWWLTLLVFLTRNRL